MSEDSKPSPGTFESALDVLPVGVAIFDSDQRAVLVNPAYCASLDLPPGSLQRGRKLGDMLLPSAIRGVFGPGDPASQVAAALAVDRSRPGRIRRRHFAGRSFDLLSHPLPDGGHVVCAVEVTGLLTAQAEAEAAFSRISTALAGLRIGLATFGPDRVLMLHNLRFSELFGLPPDRIWRGQCFAELLAIMQQREEYSSHDGEAFIAGQRDLDRARPHRARRVRANGQVVEIASDPSPDGGWTITAIDINPLATAEDEARRRASMLESLLASIPQGVCLYGADRRVRMLNRAYVEVMAGAPLAVGDSLEEVIRRRAIAGEYGPGDPDDVFAQQMAFDTSRPQMRRRRRANGTVIDVRTAPMPDGGHVSVVSDITPLTQAEEELARRASEMDVMLRNIRHGVLLWGPDRRLIACNRMASELMGHPTGLLVPGRPQSEILADMLARGQFGSGPKAEARARGLQERDWSQPYLREFSTPAGRHIEARSDPTPDGGFITTMTDITDARSVEQELRRAKEAAEAASRAKSRFLAVMSHELRTPLNAVIGFSDTLRRGVDGVAPQKVGEFASAINEAGRHLLGMIDIILDVARLESGRLDLVEGATDLASLARDSVRHAEQMDGAAGMRLSVCIEENLSLVRADERRLMAVLRQLLSNAIKFTRPGGVITVAVWMDGAEPALAVSDTGIGISKEDMPLVFQPFSQLDDGLTRRYQGAGLGLHLARAVVEGHGGTLRLSSRVGEGTRVEIRLPADRVIQSSGIAVTVPEQEQA
jgi:signal transduction histidine kinase